MNDPISKQVSLCIQDLQAGDSSAVDRLLPLIYEDLRRVARDMKRGDLAHTMQPTVLVHEAYLRLVDRAAGNYASRLHFMRVAAQAMRQILTDYKRERGAKKRGGNQGRVTLQELTGKGNEESQIDALALEDALVELNRLNERHARVVELRLLTGLTLGEVAQVLGIADRTARLDWQIASAWLARFFESETESDD